MLSVVIPLAIVLGLGAVVAVAVFLAMRLRAQQSLGISFQTILTGYFYLMSIVALLVLAVGLTTLLKAGTSDLFGREFSYWRLPNIAIAVPPPAPGQPVPPEKVQPTEEQQQQQRQAIEHQYRSDLLQGVTMAIVGAILWPLHAWGRRRLIKAGNGWTTFLARTHLTLLLVLFGVIGLISLPMGIYQFLQFFLVPVDELQPRQPPGETVALAIVFVPLWLISLVIAVREMRRESR